MKSRILHRLLAVTLTAFIIVGCQKHSTPRAADDGIYGKLLAKAPVGSASFVPTPKELKELLDAGKIDYFFTYKSTAKAMGLKIQTLNPEVNLGSEDLGPFYKRAETNLADGTIVTGSAIQYGMTVPKNAPHPEAALVFAEFLLGPQGRLALSEQGLSVLNPPHTGDISHVPAPLKGFFEKADFAASSPSHNKDVTLEIVHTGAMNAALDILQPQFEKSHPGIQLKRQAMGSVAAVREMLEKHRALDVLIVADFRLIRGYLVPEQCDWYAGFCRDEMVLAFGPQSRGAAELSQDNWTQILSRPEVRIGRSDPNVDASGYFTELSWKLADQYFKQGPEHVRNLVQRWQDRERGVALRVSVNQKMVAEKTTTQLIDMMTPDFQVPDNSVKKGISFQQFFEKEGIHLGLNDEVKFQGKGNGTYTYGQIVQAEMGIVPNRHGSAKVVARKSDKRIHIPNLKSIDITKR